MQALIELLAGFIALLAAAALSQFGVILDSSARADREVHRMSDCPPPPTEALLTVQPKNDC